MPDKARLDEALQEASVLANSVSARLDNLDLPASPRERAAYACWWVSLEHGASIIILVGQMRPTSAYALLRPQIDAVLRALWLHGTATEEEVQSVLDGNDPPGIAAIVKSIEADGSFEGELSSLQRQIWGTVSDYTHTGARQISRHVSEVAIEPVHDPEEIMELLKASAGWSLVAASGVAAAAQREDLCAELTEMTRWLADENRI